MARAVVAALAALTLAAATLAGPAHGDADPPSDILLTQDVYYPYQPPVSTASARRLDTVVRRARAVGLPVKVALVASASDLGAVPSLLGHPQHYALFLAQELGLRSRQIVLAVMTGGVGVSRASPDQRSTLAALGAPGADSNALALTAARAVAALAKAAGHPIPVPALGTDAGVRGRSSASWLAFAPVLAIAVLGAGVALRRRLRRRERRA